MVASGRRGVAFTAQTDEVVSIDGLDKAGAFANPRAVAPGAQHAARLIGQLPGHDRRILGVGHTRIAVAAREQLPQVLLIGLPGRPAAVKAGTVQHIAEPAAAFGRRRVGYGLVGTKPVVVLRHPSRPGPKIVEAQHSLHIAFRHLCQQVVEAVPQLFPILARPRLQTRLYRPGRTLRPLAAGHNPKIGHPQRLQLVELGPQPLPVTRWPACSQLHAIPIVGTQVVVGRSP